MKKLYLLSILCLLSLGVFGQSTVTIYSTGASGSYVTGYATATSRIDGNVVASSTPSTRGYAVFDLSSVPSGATITGYTIGFDVANIFGTGTPACTTYAYPGDLALVTTAAALYADIVSGTSISTASYGAAIGNFTLASTAAGITFLSAHIGSTVSICWTQTAGPTHIMTGETGDEATTGTHAPYIQITYTCSGLSGLSATAAPTSICEGETITLIGTASGAASYSWHGPSSYSATTQNASVSSATTAASGIYTFTATNSTGCDESVTTSAVTVNPLPDATLSLMGPSAFCTGGSVTIVAPSSSGLESYQWYDNGVAISGETNASYIATTTGNYSVQITDGNGCVNMSSNQSAVLLSAPAITPAGPNHLCTGSVLTLTADAGGTSPDISYQWFQGGAAISGATNDAYTTASGGAFTTALSVAGVCTVTTAPDTVISATLPIPVVSLSGPALVTDAGYTSYQWFLNTTAIPGATNSSMVPAANGSYRVRVADTNGCINFSAAYAFNSLGVAHVNGGNISIYPNPAGDVLSISAPVAVHVVIASMDGRAVMETSAAVASTVNLSNIPSGIYIVSLFNEQGGRILVQKLVKQ